MKKFYLLLIVVGVVGAGVIGWQALGPKTVDIPANIVVTAGDTAGFHGYVIGSDTAPVSIVEYADFECPYCSDFENVQWPEIYDKLVATGKVRWIYRDYPIDGAHRYARLAMHAAACADDQGKFWPMKSRLFAYQSQWSFGGGQYGKFRDYIREIGADPGQWDTCMQSAKHAGRIQASSEEGSRLGVNSTPTFLIAGRLFLGIQGSDQLIHTVDSLIAARPAASGRPATAARPATRPTR
ncbi:MAG: thioredoxin domain-containing protein [Gemmatimonadetes bacterium]|nr:thioredoxin domain-containing protein [Gemmatimonadota bacterium]